MADRLMRFLSFDGILTTFENLDKWLSSPAPHVSIRFVPASEQFGETTRGYQALWEVEGTRMIAALEPISGLPFPEREIQGVVYEGSSRSGAVGSPMRMPASYPPETKKATLIHELGRRHIARLKLPGCTSRGRQPNGSDSGSVTVAR